MTTAAQEFVYIHVDSERIKLLRAPTPRELAYAAREREDRIADHVSAAKSCLDKCERLGHQLDLGIESDLYIELDADFASTLRELVASVRIKYRLVGRQLEEAHKLADECDEAASLHEAAAALNDLEEQKEQAARVDNCGKRLEENERYNTVLCRQLHRQHLDAVAVFDCLRR